MLNLLGTKTCASTPRKEEKQKIWEWSYVGMTSVWTCGVEWCHWFRNGIRHWRFCATADVRESAIFPYQPEASIATLLSRSLPVSLDLEFHQSERYLQTRPKKLNSLAILKNGNLCCLLWIKQSAERALESNRVWALWFHTLKGSFSMSKRRKVSEFFSTYHRGILILPKINSLPRFTSYLNSNCTINPRLLRAFE